MKLLQLCNVLSPTGGTLACVYSIKKALPDWEHHVVGCNSGTGSVAPAVREWLGCDVQKQRRMTPALYAEISPDVVIYHNVSTDSMGQSLPDCLRFYYQHSAFNGAMAARKRCDYFWTVSNWLRDRTGVKHVYHQPCPVPVKTAPRATEFTVGRICTPLPKKWRDVVPLYRRLASENPEVQWEFVGATGTLQDELTEAVGGKAQFYSPSWEARSHLHRWHAVLYDSELEESYGRIVCEAQRCGTIPIVSARGGFMEQIEHGRTGFLCNGPDEFSQCLKLARDPDVRADVSVAAKDAGDFRGSLQRWREQFLNWVEAAVAV